ncbi:MAG: FAD-binding and (Fe-S)-binding domain-containing protein [Acidobacteriota bacterium]
MFDQSYSQVLDQLRAEIPEDRLIHDPLRTLAYGTDASFYRLVPKLVVEVESEAEVVAVLRECRKLRLPVTFRAAGTSLSGQAVTDSVLIRLGRGWKKIQISADASQVTLQPGVVGAHANARLLPHGRKIGPDPASINSAMIGGIAANNASGMCCGTAQNSYRTLAGLRVVLEDGTILDTRNPESCERFLHERSDLVTRLQRLAACVRQNQTLAGRIQRKFKMKNTTGYSLNALVDFDSPIDILAHLMIGSEGTLGFISEITYHTVPEHPCKATALVLFPDVRTACQAIPGLRQSGVSAVELMDRASLRSVESKAGMPGYLRHLDEAVCGLLVETRARSSVELQTQMEKAAQAIALVPTVRPLEFTSDPVETAQLWNIRKGLFPSVGAVRPTGTTIIIEDVCFPLPRLAEAALELQELFNKHDYHEAILFGHALEGNLHFVFHQDFNRPEEVQRYAGFMDELTHMVVERYDGSLKAEHGTGRNMAPFVELEWGAEAYTLMKEIKAIFDPENLLNPGVILNSNPRVHLENLKPLPAADPIVDKCIECGFCEVNCPSKDLSLTPRQRIAIWREISRLQREGGASDRIQALRQGFVYQGNQTCATDGLCATSCPVNIDTGKLIKEIRQQEQSELANRLAGWVARHFALVSWGLGWVLQLGHWTHLLLGTRGMTALSGLLRKISGDRLPQWNPFVPQGAARVKRAPVDLKNPLKVVYLPSCINRTLRPAFKDEETLHEVVERLLRKAGYEVVYPGRLGSLCCGMAFASKGFDRQGEWKLQELRTALLEASNGGAWPILVDTSPCVYRLKENGLEGLNVYEPVEFVLRFLRERLSFTRKPGTVAIHTVCSSRKMGLEAKLNELAKLCAEGVIVPENIGCCGFAGDRGFSYPELTASALHDLNAGLPSSCTAGYSTSTTCELGLSRHGGIPYRSILRLVDEHSRALERS